MCKDPQSAPNDSSSVLDVVDESMSEELSQQRSVSPSIVVCELQPPQVEVQPALTLAVVDHHFVPGAERLRASYTCANLEGDTIRLVVEATEYGGDVVYRSPPLTDATGTHALQWRGEANVGALSGSYINPLHSPYTLRIEAQAAGLTDDGQTRVLYRSVTLTIGTYTASGAAPNRLADPRGWVQYELDELGYFAGPVSGNIVDDDQTCRAMERYAHQHPALSDQAVRFNGAAYHTNPALVAALTNGEQGRQIIEHGRLPGEGEHHKIYLDHNYYYYNDGDFDSDDGHIQRDDDILDRFELPLEVTVSLMSQDDADGTADGIVSPRATGQVQIEWTSLEHPEPVNDVLPASTPNRPSRARQYVGDALVAVMDQPQIRDNCPVAQGGSREDAPNTNRSYFRIGADLPPFTSTNVADRVYSQAHQGDVVGKRGKAGILFRGSRIAGDNYVLHARISVHDRPNQGALEQAHADVFGQEWGEILWARTGRMTTWRRHRVAAVINWPAPGGAIQWANVAAEYAQAFCELDHGHIATMTGAQFLANLQDVGHQDFQTGAGPHISQSVNPGGPPIVFNGHALLPLQIPAQGNHETAATYKQRLKQDLEHRISANALQLVAEGVAAIINANHPPGAIVIHGKWIPTVAVRHRPLWGLLQGELEHFDPRLFCIGLTKGVAILQNDMFAGFQDRFVVTHEMGHSRYLRHHEAGHGVPDPDGGHRNDNSDNPQDHDLTDRNCMMSYPHRINTRQGLSWGNGVATQASFCGKCLLKLRGWRVTAGIPTHS